MSLVWLALLGLAIGFVLGGLGGGGAILTVPALVYVAGESAAQATTTSLVVVGAAAVVGAAGHVRSGTVAWRTGLFFGAAGIPAAWIGSHLSHAVDGSVLMLGFSLLMLGAAIAMLRPVGAPAPLATPVPVPAGAAGPAPTASTSGQPDGAAPQCVRCGRWPFVVGAGLGVGLLTGFFGVGGGFVIVPALVLALGFTMPEAVGTSLLVITINSLVAMATRLQGTGIEWHVVIPFTVASLIGVLVGGRLTKTRDASSLQRWFVGLLVVVALYTAIRSIVSL